jgi:hypothetical protein
MFGRPSLVGAMARGLLADWLVVGGGNGGQTGIFNATDSGSGSGGTVLFGQSRFRVGDFAVTVGQGGLGGGTTGGSVGFSGTNSIIAGIADSGLPNGLGGGYNPTGVQVYGWGGPRGAAFGFNGNGGAPGGGTSYAGVAGKAGGAGCGAGGSATGKTPGAGVISSISGAAVEYGRGGTTSPEPLIDTRPAVPSIPGTGGSGVRGDIGAKPGGNGAPGIVIIRYPGISARAAGGIVQVLGGFVIHTFYSNATFSVRF